MTNDFVGINIYIIWAIGNPLGLYDWILEHITELTAKQSKRILRTVREIEIWEAKRTDITECHEAWLDQLGDLRYLLARRLEMLP